MNNFLELFNSHNGKVIHKWSSYLYHYERHFSIYREIPINLLEIGVQSGGSLEIWGKYFVNAKFIIGCDIEQNCSLLSFENANIKIIIGDANESITKEKIIENTSFFDIIIDDGSHTSIDIIKSFLIYFQYLNNDGIYVIEDIHASYWKEYGGGLYFPFSSMSFFKKLADVINCEHWQNNYSCSDILLGFKKYYDLSFDENLLKSIHSIEFTNSICFVRKKKYIHNNLGVHMIYGEYELDNFDKKFLIGKSLNAPSQFNNFWSNLDTSPDEDWLRLYNEVCQKNDQIKLLQHKIDSIFNSKSWKYTKPFRFFSILLKSFFKMG